MLTNNDYNFGNSPFEPSNTSPIPHDQLTMEELGSYLQDSYHTHNKPYNQKPAIQEIIGTQRAQCLISKNKTEYFKILTHFMILSKAHSKWDNLLITGSARTSKPSVSDHPSHFAVKEAKKINDAIIRCFYARLIQGMEDKDKKRYSMLLPDKRFPTHFDQILLTLDKAIQNLFSVAQAKIEGYQSEISMPDRGLDEAIAKTRQILRLAFHRNKKKNFGNDTLRAALIKSASINRAINDIDAILNLHEEIPRTLPEEDIRRLKDVQSEIKIIPEIAKTFNAKEEDLPGDLLECAKLVCKIYIITSPPPEKKPDSLELFHKIHTAPSHVAVSAALLYQDHLHKNKLNLHIRGETTPSISVYKTLADFATRINSESLSENDLWNYGFPQYLFKYLTTRYSISVMGLSDWYPSKAGALAHLKVRRKKLELQKETYELLKDRSINSIYLSVIKFCNDIDWVVNTEREQSAS